MEICELIEILKEISVAELYNFSISYKAEDCNDYNLSLTEG